MKHRLLLGIGALFVLVLLTGCTAFTGATSEAGLGANATYDWDTEADVVIDLEGSSYKAVHRIENRSSITLYQRTRYGTEHPLPVRAIQFRHENGTTVNASAMDVSESRSSVTVSFPAETGQFAYTGSKRSKEYTSPVFTEGSHVVKVPPDHDVDNFVLGTVRPRGGDQTMVENRVHISWDGLSSGSLRVNYYLERDLYLFAGLVVTVSVIAAIALGYVYRQMQQLRRRREELGLDIDTDDSKRRPPPGMR